MAGGDDDSPARLFGQDTVAYHRRGGSLGAEVNLYSTGGGYFGGGLSKVLRGKASVIADNQSSIG